MPRTWLADAEFFDMNVEERHRLAFEFGDHENSNFENSELHVKLRSIADADRYMPQRSLDLLSNAAQDGGTVRLGIFGLAVAPDASQPKRSMANLFSGPIPPPLHRSSDGVWHTWRLDLPNELKTATSDAIEAENETTLIWQMTLPINSEIYPITLRAGLVLLDDALVLQVQKDAKRSDRRLNETQTALKLGQASGERSVFGVAFVLGGNGLLESSRLTSFEIELSGDSDGSDLELHGPDEQNHIGVQESARGRIMFTGFDPCRLDEHGNSRMNMLIKNHDILTNMGVLNGSFVIECDGLLCGVNPVLSSGSGDLIYPQVDRENSCKVSTKTTTRVSFQINLVELFRRRPVSIHTRLQFPDRGLSPDRIAAVEQVFRNVGFDTPERTESSEGEAHFIQARRIVEGADRRLIILLRTISREIQLETGGSSERVTSRRSGGDTTVDIAVVGPDHWRLPELLRDVQRRVADVFRGR